MDNWWNKRRNCREFVVEIIPNRRADTIFQFFEQHVNQGFIFVTDGYPSYPTAVSRFGSMHEVVNHSIAFTNQNGSHTNQITNLWSHLKQEYRARGGVNRNRI